LGATGKEDGDQRQMKLILKRLLLPEDIPKILQRQLKTTSCSLQLVLD